MHEDVDSNNFQLETSLLLLIMTMKRIEMISNRKTINNDYDKNNL